VIKTAELDASAKNGALMVAGNVRFWEGYLLSIYAFRLLSRDDPGATLHMVLGTHEPAPIRSLLRELGLEARVRLSGWLPRPALREELKRSCLFIYPDFDRAAAPLCVEALAAGSPVLAFKGGGADSALSRDCSMQLDWGPPRDVARKMAGAMKIVIANESRRRQMGLAALRHVRDSLTWERLGSRLEAIYGEAILQGETIRIDEADRGRRFY
jgi:glycosyltransferase involved in cell wall biosynthesis